MEGCVLLVIIYSNIHDLVLIATHQMKMAVCDVSVILCTRDRWTEE